ncbi:regulator of chromosome condensation 1/beta-lactamase-inhibitor protein II [Dimargaris cristalligena]|uniref:Regulator of chromosome condensation 1/beta-lactamase-inhibitor protein II n=1 Tax=Dimargaris cristalligena TaxID=215637 RepID=A0A4P9ZVM8_9FUNG|nr:regulator of chromosome condensation 1/beta-lactamase-inhibitor protein II [Dimargaris cristalligena]|eukprot:RKP36690.1 regulator of chromosome condensation 1/beta-lactamase-inhibitor protein II [Dimargaris cristalligena]
MTSFNKSGTHSLRTNVLGLGHNLFGQTLFPSQQSVESLESTPAVVDLVTNIDTIVQTPRPLPNIQRIVGADWNVTWGLQRNGNSSLSMVQWGWDESTGQPLQFPKPVEGLAHIQSDLIRKVFNADGRLYALTTDHCLHQVLALTIEHIERGIIDMAQTYSGEIFVIRQGKPGFILYTCMGAIPGILSITSAALVLMGRFLHQYYNTWDSGGIATWSPIEKTARDLLVPNIMSPPRFTQLAAGWHHFLALTDAGDVYSWGQSRLSPVPIPTIIEAVQGIPISHIACGAWHSALVSEPGDVYTFGRSDKGQLGRLGDSGNRTSLPQLAEFTGEVEPHLVTVACGEAHTVVVSADGQPYVAGWEKVDDYGTK